MQRLRLRGDWSDTGPNARPERDSSSNNTRDEDETSESNVDNVDAENRPMVCVNHIVLRYLK